jgi:hypothetical protein
MIGIRANRSVTAKRRKKSSEFSTGPVEAELPSSLPWLECK